jgi:membrane protein YdbS with pleckstrin-like domain
MKDNGPDFPGRVKRVWYLSSAIGDVAVLLICAVAAVVLMHLGWWGFWQRAVVVIAAVLSVLDLVLRPLVSRYEYTVNRFILGQHEGLDSQGMVPAQTDGDSL